jgi:hypothetical protein
MIIGNRTELWGCARHENQHLHGLTDLILTSLHCYHPYFIKEKSWRLGSLGLWLKVIWTEMICPQSPTFYPPMEQHEQLKCSLVGWQSGSNDRAPVLRVWGPEFKPQLGEVGM